MSNNNKEVTAMTINSENLLKAFNVTGKHHGCSTVEEFERAIRLMPDESQKVFVTRWGIDGSEYCNSLKKFYEKMEIDDDNGELYNSAVLELDATVDKYQRMIKEFSPEEFEKAYKCLKNVKGVVTGISNFSFKEFMHKFNETMGIPEDENVDDITLRDVIEEAGLGGVADSIKTGLNKVKESGSSAVEKVKKSVENGTLKEDTEHALVDKGSAVFQHALRTGNKARMFGKKKLNNIKKRGTKVWGALFDELEQEDMMDEVAENVVPDEDAFEEENATEDGEE